MRQQLKDGCKEWFKDVLEAIPSGWIAGGCVRDYFARMETDSDIDVFFPSAEALADGIRGIEQANNAKRIYDREHVVGYLLNRRHVQLIKQHFFPSAQDTIAQFDFTVCCATLTPSGDIFHHEHFFEDLAGRRLAINALPFPLSTLERIQKYAAKGFHACNGTLTELARAIQQLDMANPSQNQLQFYPNGSVRFARFD